MKEFSGCDKVMVLINWVLPGPYLHNPDVAKIRVAIEKRI